MATNGTSVSTLATAQTLALTKGPNSGSHAPAASAKLYLLDDVATMAVDQTITTATPEYLKFGKIPKGAKIVPFLSRLTTNHTAAVAGKIVLVALDGVTAAVEIASVTIQLEALAVAHDATTLSVVPDSFLDNAACGVATADSWVCFLPASNLVCASSIKTFWARIVYAMTY
jgi:hypothetical protein